MDIRTNIRTKISVRSYLTAGVAALGAGAIVMAPVQPLPERSTLTPALSSSLAVDLAASIDPITPWIETFQTATVNIERIITAATSTPLPIITQVITNFGTYLAELPDIGTILGQVVGNVGNALGAPFAVQDPIEYLARSRRQGEPRPRVSTSALNQQFVFAAAARDPARGAL